MTADQAIFVVGTLGVVAAVVLLARGKVKKKPPRAAAQRAKAPIHKGRRRR